MNNAVLELSAFDLGFLLCVVMLAAALLAHAAYRVGHRRGRRQSNRVWSGVIQADQRRRYVLPPARISGLN